jgi:hypothetical protein
MHANSANVKVGAIFRSESGQLHKILELSKDDQGRTRVRYASKSASLANQAFSSGASESGPALTKTFLGKCGTLLGSAELAQLRTEQILQPGE